MTNAKNKTVNVEDVKAFYDKFSETRMRQYRSGGNLRIQFAIKLAKTLLRPGFRVVDVGCGVGLVAEAMAKAEPTARIVATDLSDSNIAQAREVVTQSNVELFQSDVRDQETALQSRAPEGYNLISLVDVIEHIPESDRPALLSMLSRIAAHSGFLMLTYPSPDYIRWLEENEPEELQIIDHAIEPEVLIAEAAETGWHLRSMEYKDIWRRNQYVHAVFQRERPLEHMPQIRPSLAYRIRRRIGRTVRAMLPFGR